MRLIEQQKEIVQAITDMLEQIPDGPRRDGMSIEFEMLVGILSAQQIILLSLIELTEKPRG